MITLNGILNDKTDRDLRKKAFNVPQEKIRTGFKTKTVMSGLKIPTC